MRVYLETADGSESAANENGRSERPGRAVHAHQVAITRQASRDDATRGTGQRMAHLMMGRLRMAYAEDAAIARS